LAFPLSWVGYASGALPTATRFASISKSSVLISSRVVDLISFNVNPKYYSNALAKVIFSPVEGGLISTRRLLQSLFNLLMKSTTLSSYLF